MKDTQTRKYNSGLRCLQIIDNYNSIWSGNTTASDNRDKVEQALEDIQAAETAQQNTSTGGEETTKEEAKHNMAELTQSICQGICAYALDTNDHNLYNQMNKKSWFIERLKDVESTDFCTIVRGYVATHSASLLDYNITPGMGDDLALLITAFQTASPSPMNAKGQHHTATNNVGLAIVKMLHTLLWWDHFTAGLHTSQPDFTSDFQSARHIVDTGVRHMSIRGVVTDSVNHTPLYRAKISVVTASAPPTVFSGRSGKFQFFSFVPAVYTLKVELEGYQTLTIPNISVFDKKITDVVVQLIPA